MKIKRIISRIVAVPRRRKHQLVTYSQNASSYLIVQIETTDGICGFGEASIMPEWGGVFERHYGEPPAVSLALANELLSPLLISEEPLEIERLRHRLNGAVLGYPYTKAAFEMALFDLKGKVLGVPVYELLGGAYRKQVPIMHSVGIMDTESAVIEACHAVNEGARYIKVKVGQDAAHDKEVTEKICEAVSSVARIFVDFNGGYKDASDTMRMMRCLEANEVAAAEEPVSGAEALRRLRSMTATPIVADESVWSTRDIIELWHQEAIDGVSLYIYKAGGLRLVQAAVQAAANLDLMVNINGSGELGIGNAANLQVAAVAPRLGAGCVIPVSAPSGRGQTQIAGRTYIDDIISAPLDYRNGELSVPTGPGLGVEVDMAKVEKYTVRK